MSDDTLLIALLALPFAGSVAALFLPANARNAEAWLAGAVALAGLLVAAQFYPDVARAEVIRSEFQWLPGPGLNFTLRMDGFAWMFAVLVAGIGFLVVLYARYYMSPQDPVPRSFSRSWARCSAWCSRATSSSSSSSGN
jgi:multicomponent K+:H+ antiporter subunit A